MEKNISINPNRSNNISVAEVIDNIDRILNLNDDDLENNIKGENKMSLLSEPIITTIVGSVIGFVAAMFSGWLVFQREKENKKICSCNFIL